MTESSVFSVPPSTTTEEFSLEQLAWIVILRIYENRPFDHIKFFLNKKDNKNWSGLQVANAYERHKAEYYRDQDATSFENPFKRWVWHVDRGDPELQRRTLEQVQDSLVAFGTWFDDQAERHPEYRKFDERLEKMSQITEGTRAFMLSGFAEMCKKRSISRLAQANKRDIKDKEFVAEQTDPRAGMSTQQLIDDAFRNIVWNEVTIVQKLSKGGK
ncbi:MAG: hypothetical protein Q9166_005301 [cf. Caloplaca sp. 2 TL-2023]